MSRFFGRAGRPGLFILEVSALRQTCAFAMDYIEGLDAYTGTGKTAVMLGKFDGFHLGHQKILNKAKEYESADCRTVVCAFDMHQPGLMTAAERRAFLEDRADVLVSCPFTQKLKEMEAEDFIRQILAEKFHAAHLIVGTDCSFGHNRRGNAATLEEKGPAAGFTVDVVKKECYCGREISSTYIRELLEAGDLALANRLLGYTYAVSGRVEHGKRLGRRLGFPTMNVVPDEMKIMPHYGVYACRVKVDGRWHPAIGNVGVKPTVTAENRCLLEVYLYDYNGDAYEKETTVQLLKFVRPEQKFADVEALKKRVLSDMEQVKGYFSAEK